jgi:hypothetical protein
MNRVAARRLARAGQYGRAYDPRQAAQPRRVRRRRIVADQRPTLVAVLARQQCLERRIALFSWRIPVERVAIGEGELGALRHDVDELGRRELGEVEAGEERELL